MATSPAVKTLTPQRHGLPTLPTAELGAPAVLSSSHVQRNLVMPKTALCTAQAILPTPAGWPEQPGVLLPTMLGAWTAMASS